VVNTVQLVFLQLACDSVVITYVCEGIECTLLHLVAFPMSISSEFGQLSELLGYLTFAPFCII